MNMIKIALEDIQVISVAENPQEQKINSKFEDRLLGYHPSKKLDSCTNNVSYYIISLASILRETFLKKSSS